MTVLDMNNKYSCIEFPNFPKIGNHFFCFWASYKATIVTCDMYLNQFPLISSLVPKIQLISTGWSSIWPLEPHQKSRMVPCFMYLAVFRGFKTFNQAVKPALKQRIWLVDHMGPKNIIFHLNQPKLNRQSWLIERSGKRVITESIGFSTCNEKIICLNYLMDRFSCGFRRFSI